jgi:hypothetical protein
MKKDDFWRPTFPDAWKFLIDVQDDNANNAFFNQKHLHFFLKFKITFLAIGIVAWIQILCTKSLL